MKNKRKNRHFQKPKLVLGILFICLLFVPACQSRRSEQSAFLTKKDNIVVILIDTLRADSLPFHGYHNDTAPYLNSLARQGVIFDRAFSSSSFTAPSIASIFTSLYPSEHGVITGFVATKRHATETGRLPINRISHAIETLPEAMRAAGYKTFGVSDNFNIVEAQGFTQGFEHFENFSDKGADVLHKTLRSWKSEMQKGDAPYFLYLHYMEPHSPYLEHAPWFEKGKNAIENQRNAYDSEIRFLDGKIQEIAAEFGWEKNALIIVVSDHGEEFLEHGARGHGKTLYTEVLHVPLFFYHRNMKPARVYEAVHTMDIFPTLMAEIGRKSSPSWRGTSLQGVFTGKEQAPKRELFSELLRRPEHPRDPKRSVLYDGHHLIHSWNKADVHTYELYDLKEDFEEKQDLVSRKEAQEKLVAGKEVLRDFEAGKHSQAEESSMEVDAEALEQLKTLGYLE